MTYKPFIRGVVSEGNSSITPLLTGTTFTGTGEQNDYAQIGVMLKTDVGGTLFFDFSNDGTNWDSTFPVGGFEVNANISEFHTAVKLGRYFRLRLVNNGADQTFLRLTTYYGDNFVPSALPLNQSIAIDNDATMVRPTLAEDEIIIGRRSGVAHFNKFGYRSGLTASAGEETIWTAGGNFVPMIVGDTLTITYNNATDGLGTTGALSIYFEYVDSNGLKAEAQHVLGNTGSDVTSFSALGINRAALASVGTATFNNNDITISDTGGVYGIQAFIGAGVSVTNQMIFHTDANSDGIGKFLWFNVGKGAGGGNPKVLVKGYVFNRQFQIRFEIFRSLIDTAVGTNVVILEPVGFKLSPQDVLYFIADTDTNNTDIAGRFSLVEYKRT